MPWLGTENETNGGIIVLHTYIWTSEVPKLTSVKNIGLIDKTLVNFLIDFATVFLSVVSYYVIYWVTLRPGFYETGFSHARPIIYSKN